MHCKTRVTTISVWYFGSWTRSATRSISSDLVMHASPFRSRLPWVGPPLSPTQKRTQTLPLSRRLSACALSVPCSSAVSQMRLVSCVPCYHASEGQSCIGGMLAKRQPSVNIFSWLSLQRHLTCPGAYPHA